MKLIDPHLASLFGLHLPPPVALLATVCFVVFLFRRDLRQHANVTGALWIPLLWVLLIGSRSIVQWLHVFGLAALGSTEEGNPLDALIYFTLTVAGLCVLNKRQVDIAEVIRNNAWLMAFLLYCFITIMWSDYPFVSFKRWIKILGHPIIALVLFTEPHFEEAVARLMKRAAYVLVPFSILLIKYYPEIGRSFDQWTGLAANNGVGENKNVLGCISFILSFFLFWHFLKTWHSERSVARRNELRLTGVLLVMIGWLILKAHSATSFLSLAIGIIVMVVLGWRWLNKRIIGMYAILAIVVLIVAQSAFGIFERIVEFTGHNATIVGRAELWRELLALHTNPVFGVGFESFWLGDRLTLLHEGRPWQPNEAHNGYLEIYLNLGLVGLVMLAGLIIATFRKIRLELLRNFNWGRLRLGFLVAIVLYNWTEAAFRGLSLVWFVFYIIAMDYPRREYESVLESSEIAGIEEEREFAYGRSGED